MRPAPLTCTSSYVKFLGKEITIGVALTRKIRKEGSGDSDDPLCLIITTNEIVHDIGMPDAFRNLFLVANVPFLPEVNIVAGAFVLFK